MPPDFLQTYDDHVGAVYGYLGYRAIPATDAEQLTRATFERALAAPDRPDPDETQPRRWLLEIARGAYGEYRRFGRPSGDPLADSAQAAHRDGPGGALSAPLGAAIRGLSHREREAVALRFGAEMRSDEIAEFLDIDVAAAKRALARALRRLGPDLADRVEHADADR